MVVILMVNLNNSTVKTLVGLGAVVLGLRFVGKQMNMAENDPDFDREKADRNKDGEISDWEQAVGNAVAKGIREHRKGKSESSSNDDMERYMNMRWSEYTPQDKRDMELMDLHYGHHNKVTKRHFKKGYEYGWKLARETAANGEPLYMVARAKDLITKSLRKDGFLVDAGAYAGFEDSWRVYEGELNAESFGAEKLHPGLYRYKGKIRMRKGWTECQECDDLIKQDEINFAYIEGYGNATVCDTCVEKSQGFKRMDDYIRKNWTSWKDWGEEKDYSKKYVPVRKRNEWGESEIYRLAHDGIIKNPYRAESFGVETFEAEGGIVWTLFDRKTKDYLGEYDSYEDAYEAWELRVVDEYPARVSESEWIVIEQDSM